MMWSPERFGQLIGAAAVVMALLAGILKCGFIIRRPTTSTLCVLSLMMFLGGWFISALGQLVQAVFQFPPGPLSLVGGIISILFIFPAVILGIVGLATYDPKRFQQGRSQALWAIGLGVLASLAILAGIVVSISKWTTESWSPPSSRPAEGPIENVEFNFSVTPSSKWLDLKPSAVNKLACLALRQSQPEMYAMVIAERLPSPLDVGQVLEIVKSYLESASIVQEQSEETVELNGLTFAHMSSKVYLETAGMTMGYEHWLVTHRGFSWQIVFWTSGDRKALASEARTFIETFHLLDPTMDAAGKGTAKDVTQAPYGYETKIEGMGWSPWTDTSLNTLIDFSAKHGNEALIVVPLRFDTPPPDLKALTRGLLSTLDFENTAPDNFKENPWSPGHGGTGRELEIEREVDGTRYHYILRVARGENSAHLIAGWAALPNGDLDFLRRSLDAFQLHPPEGEPPPLTKDQEIALGLILNEAGLSLMSRNENKSAAIWFYKGFEHGNDPTILGNAGDALGLTGEPDKAIKMLSPHMDKFPTHRFLGLRYARLQVLNGDMDGGEATFLRLIKEGLNDEDDLLAWLQLLNENEQFPAALRCADAWVAKNPTKRSRRWQAQIYSLSGDSPRSITILEELLKEDPDDRLAGFDLGESYNRAGEHAKAAAVAEDLIARGKDSSRAFLILGWSQMGQKWYRDAKASFEQASKLEPKDEDIQSAIQSASAALGQGNNSQVKEPIAPVGIPPEVASLFGRDPVSADFGEGHAYAWLLYATGYHYEKGKSLRKTRHRSAKILTAEGARDFSSVEVTFNPLIERIFMNRLEVKDANGVTVAKASFNDVYVRDFDNGTASDQKVLHMQVAGVQPGTIVEWEVTMEEYAPSESFAFERHLFASSMPIAAEAVFVTGDVSMLHTKLDQGKKLKLVETKDLVAWIARDQPAVLAESFALPAEKVSPMLWLGGDEGSWEEVGNQYLKEIEDRLTVDQSLKDLAASLVEGLTEEREKIAVIARFTQKEIAYKAIEFGVRARRPNRPDDTLHLRYGDCKDTALLTHLLLRAAGITSHLALVHSDWNTETTLPSLDQFNHMVVLVPSLGPNWLLDPTDKFLALDRFPADDLWYSHALILDPSGPRLIEPPVPPSPESCQVSSQRQVTLEDTDWRVEETLDLTGYYAAWMRGAFTGLTPAEQMTKAQNILARQGAAQVHDFHFDNIKDLSKPAQLTLIYSVRNGATSMKNYHTGTLPALWERDYLATEFVKDRQTAFEVIYPLHFSSEITAKLPMAPLRESVDALTMDANSPFGTWSLKPEIDDNEARLRFDFLAKFGTYSADNYAEFHELWDSARRALDKPLTWMTK